MTFYYSENNGKHHRHGVGIIVDNNTSKSVTECIPYSNRLMLLKIQATPVNINIIQVNAPTSDKPDEKMVTFYNPIKQLLRYTKRYDINIIQGDFNGKVSNKEIVHGIVGPFGLDDK